MLLLRNRFTHSKSSKSIPMKKLTATLCLTLCTCLFATSAVAEKIIMKCDDAILKLENDKAFARGDGWVPMWGGHTNYVLNDQSITQIAEGENTETKITVTYDFKFLRSVIVFEYLLFTPPKTQRVVQDCRKIE